jgi:hypothetical protein
MVSQTSAQNSAGIQEWIALPGNGRLSRSGSIGPAAGGNGSGTDPHAITEGEIAATEASLTEMRERRLAEVRLRDCE